MFERKMVEFLAVRGERKEEREKVFFFFNSTGISIILRENIL